MKSKLLLLLCGLQGVIAKSWVKETTVHWRSTDSSAVSVFDEGTGQKIGDLKMGRLQKTVPNLQEINWTIRNAGGKVVESGKVRVEHYPYSADSLLQKVPKGKVTRHRWDKSAIYPGTRREYLVYVPAQYDGKKPAALMVFQDGLRHAAPGGNLRATTVMDNLIAKGEMPVTIGVFVNPGRFERQSDDEKPGNWSVEYDSLGDAYARFLLAEILPQVGETYRISEDPAMRAIAGGSSGGICSWTVCWERPESFGKALIWVGTFVDIRGGHHYPAIVRKTPKKNIRAYLLAGENDLDNRFGNWPLANQQMAASLRFAGYDHHFYYGKCFHGSKEAGAKLPEMMRWLWRDWRKERSETKPKNPE